MRALFVHDPLTGWMIRRVTVNPRAKKGAVAGSVDGQGHLHVMISGKFYQLHQLVWMYHFDCFAYPGLDHINRVKVDNRLENLRPATQQQQNTNSGSRRNSASKYKGVSRHTNGRWQAQTKLNGVQKHFGLFDTEEEAHAVYCAFMVKHHGEYFAP